MSVLTATRSRRRPQQREKVEQAHVVRFLLSLGGRVYVSGTRRRRGTACPTCGTFVPEDQATRQTPGIPDVEAFLPLPPCAAGADLSYSRVLLKVEVKASDGRLSSDQEAYRDQVLHAPPGVYYVSGGLTQVLAWATRQGYVKADNIPHYRRDAASQTAPGRRRRTRSNPATVDPR